MVLICFSQIREVFETFDTDGSGEIDVDELFVVWRVRCDSVNADLTK